MNPAVQSALLQLALMAAQSLTTYFGQWLDSHNATHGIKVTPSIQVAAPATK